jgi:hypothetical protein
LPAAGDEAPTSDEDEEQPPPVNKNLDIDNFFDPPTAGEKGKNRRRRCKKCA